MKKYVPTFFEASLKSIIKPNKDSTKSYKPVNRISITHCTFQHVYLQFPICSAIYMPQFLQTEWRNNLEFNHFHILILQKLSPLLDAFVSNFLSNYFWEEWLPDNST